AAEILKPYVRDEVCSMIRAHQDFQGRHYYQHFGGDPDAREQYRGQPWFDLAARFADEWDQISFDPDYDTEPLEHFEPLVEEILDCRAETSGALGEEHQGLATFHDFDAAAQRLAVRGAAPNRERAQRGDELAEERHLPERVLAHVAHAAPGDAGDEREVDE